MASDAADLARLRAIAEAGRRRPLLGGPPLVIWGLAIALAALGHWAFVAGLVRPPWWGVSLWWFAVTGGAAVLAGSWRTRGTDADSPVSTGNRVSRAVWGMAGAFLGVLALGLTLKAALATAAGSSGAWLLLAVMPPVTFGVYGIALTATAVAADVRWLRDYAWVAFGFTVGTAALIGEEAQFALMAAGAITTSVVPGVRLLRTGGRG